MSNKKLPIILNKKKFFCGNVLAYSSLKINWVRVAARRHWDNLEKPSFKSSLTIHSSLECYTNDIKCVYMHIIHINKEKMILSIHYNNNSLNLSATEQRRAFYNSSKLRETTLCNNATMTTSCSLLS